MCERKCVSECIKVCVRECIGKLYQSVWCYSVWCVVCDARCVVGSSPHLSSHHPSWRQRHIARQRQIRGELSNSSREGALSIAFAEIKSAVRRQFVF